jgi:hypothetical protein
VNAKINRFKDRYRHELKYFIGIVGLWEYRQLSKIFSRTLRLDPHCRNGSDYWIRSLYFDTLENDDYFEKLSGVYRRKKIRLRIYDLDQGDAKIEIKNKVKDYIFKESAALPREDALELMRGGKEVLLKSDNPTMNNVYYHLCRDFYRPAVLVDYEREAYIGPSNDMRITFDKNIRGTGVNFGLYDRNVHMLPIFDNQTMVMEIKYKEYLPHWIAQVLRQRSGERYAISKYCFSRALHFS